MKRANPRTCPHCGRTQDECGCQLLICHTCEARLGSKHRAVEQDGHPAVRFREIHAKCAREEWGSNV